MSDSPRTSRDAAVARRLTIEKYGNVGEVWHSDYWNENYTVLSHNENGTVTVRWSDGRETTHRTRLSRRDYRVSPVPLDQISTVI